MKSSTEIITLATAQAKIREWNFLSGKSGNFTKCREIFCFLKILYDRRGVTVVKWRIVAASAKIVLCFWSGKNVSRSGNWDSL